MDAKFIKEKLTEAVINAVVLGLGALILYAISIALVGDAKFSHQIESERNSTLRRESELSARISVLENIENITPTNKPSALRPSVSGYQAARQWQKQYLQENTTIK